MKDTKKIEQAASLEELFERLDRVIGGLEGEELSLEDSFNLYQEGMELCPLSPSSFTVPVT